MELILILLLVAALVISRRDIKRVRAELATIRDALGVTAPVKRRPVTLRPAPIPRELR